MAGGLVAGMILVWITAASELSSTIVLYTSRWSTMTVTMYHFLEGGEGAGSASAAAAILIFFTAGPVLLIQRRLRRQDGTIL
jgi:iron(III) transport system permease protein